ncbi:hypothetical protein [Geobacter sp. OR-1]|uniref:hypothetical protein n=1 Tax=Geobacter sp. OR-1 TaxID=1266765 RepID=UPI001364B0E2|nr:hypothetical protein [Geobacter sp. OR-1]
MDPRKKMIWDGKYDGSKYVIMGDSEFCSYYVNSPEKTIWAILETAVNQKVYPGALDACKPPDLLTQGDIIASSWPSGSTIFVNIVPTRFAYSKLPEPEAGNYDYAFRRIKLQKRDQRFNLKCLKNVLNYYIGETSFFFRNETALKSSVDAIHKQPVFFNKGIHCNRAWATELDEFALKRYEKFENNVVMTKGHKSFDWISKLNEIMSIKGIKLVVVITPLNKPLINKFAKVKSADSILHYFNYLHDATINYLVSNNIEYIDLYSAVDENSFADMIHTNERGEELIAKSLTKWINKNAINNTN